jgi:hypothetical protein
MRKESAKEAPIFLRHAVRSPASEQVFSLSELFFSVYCASLDCFVALRAVPGWIPQSLRLA